MAPARSYRGSDALSISVLGLAVVRTTVLVQQFVSRLALRFAAPHCALIIAAVGSASCASDDIGQPCPDLFAGAATSSIGSRVETREVVAQDVSFPCEELICIASEGTDGYCSKKCRNDGGCPDGFECRLVQTVGAFAQQKLCAWKHCAKRSDCGSIKSFCCKAVPGNEETNLCTFSDDGHCS